MMKRTIRYTTLVLSGGFLLALGVTTARAAMIRPNTPQAEQTIKKLRHAAKIDDRRAQGHTAEDSDVGIYYYQKGKEARDLADKLAGGQAIDSVDVEHALNTKGVVKYSPSY
jgi:hypothetical protein